MDYSVKRFKGNEEEFEKLNHLLDVSTSIMAEYFSDAYDEIVKSKSYNDQQIAGALILLAYHMLRMKRPAQQSSDLLDLISQCAKEHLEDNFKKTGSDPFSKSVS